MINIEEANKFAEWCNNNEIIISILFIVVIILLMAIITAIACMLAWLIEKLGWNKTEPYCYDWIRNMNDPY